MNPINQKLVMQVRTSDSTCSPQRTDHLSLFYSLTRFNSAARQVQIFGDVSVAVTNENVVTVKLVVAAQIGVPTGAT